MPALSPAVADIIRQYAPTAATVLGNVLLPGAGGMIAGGLAKVAVDQLTPKGRVAVDVIGDKLGITKPTLERINAVVNASLEARPDAMFKEEVTKRLEQADGIVALRLAEMAHVEEMTKLANDDTADARQAFAGDKDYTQKTIGIMIMLGFLACVGFVLGGFADFSDPNMLVLAGALIGYLSSKADVVASFYFGSSQSSKRNGDAIRQELAKR